MSTLRLPGINAGACSGLTLSGAFHTALKGGLGAAEWVTKPVEIIISQSINMQTLETKDYW